MNFYEILKTKKLGRGSPDYWTQLFAEHVGGKGEWKISEITAMLPITFRSNGKALIDYRIYGTADGAGVQTENLLGKSLFTDGKTADGTGAIVDSRFRTATVDPINVNSSTAYFTWETDVNGVGCIVSGYDENNIYIGRMFVSPGAVINTSDYRKVRFTFYTNTSGYVLEISEIDNLIFIEGSTPPETYIPHGYKLPLTLTSGTESKTTDIFIGNNKLNSINEYIDWLDYTRQKIIRYINELVLDGSEDWTYASSVGAYQLGFRTENNAPLSRNSYAYSNVFNISDKISVKGNFRFGGSVSHPEAILLINYDEGAEGIENFKHYLSVQHSLGTPVKIWYVYKEPIEQDPPLPFPELEMFNGENTLDSTETLGEVTIKGKIKPQS